MLRKEFALPLHGSITALVTPFDADGALDLPRWRALLEHQVESGTEALVVAGSTGEAAALDEDEYVALIEAAAEAVAGRVPLLAGTGLSATSATITRTRLARGAGADLALVVTPPYVRPTQEGLYRHYAEVAEHGGLPLVLYNVPPRTGVDLLPATAARLAPHPGIVGIKEARGEPERVAALVAFASEQFVVLSGDDPTAAASMLAGAAGVISVASNAAPRAMRRLCELARFGDAERAHALAAELSELFTFLGVEPNPIPVKAILAAQGRIHDGLRLPLLALTEPHRQAARELAGLDARLAA